MGYIILPPWMREKYKQSYNNLKLNGAHRMISAFDIYRTLKSVAFKQYNPIPNPKVDKNKPGIMLFSEIPESRDCEHAGIPAHWCVCGRAKEIPTDDPRAIKAGEILIKSINKILSNGGEDLCITYKDFIIMEAALKLPSNDITITLRTKPFAATFRTTIRLQDNELTITNLERLDTYSRFSKCIKTGNDERALLPLSCICKDAVNLAP